jgi:hypothetical protein
MFVNLSESSTWYSPEGGAPVELPMSTVLIARRSRSCAAQSKELTERKIQLLAEDARIEAVVRIWDRDQVHIVQTCPAK